MAGETAPGGYFRVSIGSSRAGKEKSLLFLKKKKQKDFCP
jgi:hypothetical protein